jgi:pSer/pThr/pTyr-binding forkhead associated (FHA) protein
VTGIGTLTPMRCRRCGHLNDSQANYCSSCGAPLGGGGDDDTTLSLAALEDRQALEAEFGGLLDELPGGVGMVVVRRGPNQGSSFMLDRTVTSLGRHPDSDIFLDDVTVSRRHAEITRSDRGYEVRDAGSLNGTYVDHERVDVASLHDLNELQIGRFVLTFVLGSGPQETNGGRS